MRAVTSRVRGSTRSRRPDWVTTHSDPKATVISHGLGSRWATTSTLPLPGMIRSRRAFFASLTHSAPAVSVTPQGSPPTLIRSTTWPATGSGAGDDDVGEVAVVGAPPELDASEQP